MKNGFGSLCEKLAIFALLLIPLFYTTIFQNHFVFAKNAVLGFLVLFLLGLRTFNAFSKGQFNVPSSRAFNFFALWVLWLAITMLWAFVPSLAVRSWALRSIFLFLFYFFATEEIDLKWILLPVAFSSLGVSVFALLQYYGIDFKLLPHIQITGLFDLGNLVLVKRAENTIKIYSTFGHRNYLSAYLILGIPLWLSLTVLRFSEGAELLRDKARLQVCLPLLSGAIGYLGLTGLTSYVVLLTQTRGAIGGLVLSVFFLLLFLIFRSGFSLKWLCSRYATLIAAGFVVVVFSLLSGAGNSFTQGLGKKISASFDLSKGSSGHRFLIWQAAWKIIAASPANFLAGTGAGSFQVNHVEATEKLFNSSSCLYAGNADVIVRSWYVHNEYLNVWLDSGIIGLGLFLCFLFFLFGDIFLCLMKKNGREFFVMTGMFCGMVAFALHNFVTFSCQLPSAGSLFFIFGGILVFRCGKIDIVTIPESLTKKWTVAVLVALLICVVPVLILLSECAGEYYWRQAVIDEGKGNFQGALQNYDDAIRVIGNYPELFLNKGDFLFRQKSYGPALDCFKRSVAFVPDIETHYKIALCSLELNLVEEGRFYLDLALRENPRHKRALLLRERFFGRANN